MANPKNKKCKKCGESNNDKFFKSKHDICKGCSNKSQKKKHGNSGDKSKQKELTQEQLEIANRPVISSRVKELRGFYE